MLVVADSTGAESGDGRGQGGGGIGGDFLDSGLDVDRDDIARGREFDSRCVMGVERVIDVRVQVINRCVIGQVGRCRV